MRTYNDAPFLGFPSIKQGAVSSLPSSSSLEQGLSLTTWLYGASYSGIARLVRD